MELYEQIELQECPVCGGAGLDAAQRAAHLWNIGKVLTDTPND
mgnify:CR=1 FL=1